MRLSGDLGKRAEALQGSSGALGSTPASHSSRGSGGPGPLNSTVSSPKPLNMYTRGLQGLSSASARLRPLLALSSKSSQGQKQRLDLSRHTASQMLDAIPDEFGLQVLLEETGERFQVPNCRCDMTVGELKAQLDLVAGIPFNLQRLQYLDQGHLPAGKAGTGGSS